MPKLQKDSITKGIDSPSTGAARDRVTVLVPTLNEVENIDVLIERILAATKDAAFAVDILIVDGGSRDGTQQKVLEWESKAPVGLAQSDGKGGLSGDILYGASQADTDVVVVMDADLSHPPEALPSLIGPVLDGTHDMAIGSRHVPGGKIVGWPWTRKITSRFATILAWPLVSINDPMSGFFAVKRERLVSLGREATGFKIALEVVSRGGDSLRVIEVPITFVDRQRGTSKFGVTEVSSCLRQMLLLAGGAVSTGNALRFATVGLLGVLVDYLIFNILLSTDAGVPLSNVTGFVGATVFNFLLNARWAFAETARLSDRPRWQLYLRFLSVCLLALLFRSAILSALTEAAGWSPRVAVLFAIAAAALVNFVGSAFFVFPQAQVRTTPAVGWRIFALCVAIYAVLLRGAFMGVVNLIPEEAYYWNYAQHLDFGYLDHPPMVAWLISLGTGLLGDREIGVRLLALLSWGVTALFMYKLAANLFGKTAAFITLMLLASLPVYFATGFLMTPDAPLYGAWAGCLYFLNRAMLASSRRAWIGAGICLGLGMLSKYTIALLVPSALLFLLIDRQSRHWLLRPEPYIACACALLLFSPVILWNATHEWASFAFQGMERWSGSSSISLHILVGSVLALLSPVGAIGVIGAIPRRWVVPLLSGEKAQRNRVWLFAILLSLVPFSVFVVSSLHKPPRLNWTGPVWLALLPMLASSIAAVPGTQVSGWFARFNMRVWKPTVVCLLMLYGGLLYCILVGTPGLYTMVGMGLPAAWEEMGKDVGGLARQVAAETGQEPLVAGMDLYGVSAELSFYLPERNALSRISGRHLVGRKSLMWARWFPISAASGKTILLVDHHKRNVEDARLSRYFERLGPMGHRRIMKDGRVVGEYYYRVGYGYHG